MITIVDDFLHHVARRVAEFEPWPDSEVFSIHHVQEHPPNQTRSLYGLQHNNEYCRESRKGEPAHSACSAADTYQGTIGEQGVHADTREEEKGRREEIEGCLSARDTHLR